MILALGERYYAAHTVGIGDYYRLLALVSVGKGDAVAEALRKAGKDLVYFKRDDSTLEEDFFLRTVDSLVPVEVKARSGTSKSLKTLISSDHYPDIRFGVKLHAGNIGFSDGIWTFPLFCAFLLPDVLPQLPRQ